MEKPRINLRTKEKRFSSTSMPPLSGPKSISDSGVSIKKNRPCSSPIRVSVSERDSTDRKEPMKPVAWMKQEDKVGIEWGSPDSRKGRISGNESRSVWALIISIGGAVLLGTLMGFLILNLFFSDGEEFSSRSIDSHLKGVPSQGKEQKAGDQKSTANSPEKKRVRVPVLKAVLIQGGIFQEKKGAEGTLKKYRTQGLAATMTATPPYRIYQGIGTNRDDALSLTSFFKRKEVDIYLKEIRIGDNSVSVSKEDWEKSGGELSSNLKEGNFIFKVMVEATVHQLRSDKAPSGLPMKEINTSYQEFQEKGSKVEKSLPRSARPYFNQMRQAMDQVVESAKAGDAKPDDAVLWQVQEGLLRYALAYELFVKALDGN
ncbi:hypothetical protein GXN76_06135 [Kroppenstedtia pulmonis]|uniref:SPOR domain-containing protein n=1 Tax=Kroppenstedtia pulmonis TaxID=1380685 RepID=A0A7D4CET2_9BACL|nr:hypothetical protein [Kroppenstedtia pulmonis]QKG84094.1 hypothetical protein GXN76_06135 [Kroppenstedtia pulmonis]